MMTETVPLNGDGKLHLSEVEFAMFVEQALIVARKITDGNGLKVFVHFDERRAQEMAKDMLMKLTSEAGNGAPHYELVIGGAEPVRRRPTAEALFSGKSQGASI